MGKINNSKTAIGTGGSPQTGISQGNLERKAWEAEEKDKKLREKGKECSKLLEFDNRKFDNYLFDFSNPKNAGKAKFLEDVLGYKTGDGEKLFAIIKKAIYGEKPIREIETEYGKKMEFNIRIPGNNGEYEFARIVVVVQKDDGKISYRIITVYPGRKDED